METNMLPIFQNIESLDKYLSDKHFDVFQSCPRVSLMDLMQKQDFDHRFEPLYLVRRAILKILLGQRIEKEQIVQLKPYEKEIVLLFIKKKRLFSHLHAEMSEDYMHLLWKNPTHRSTEENLKFIFKKSFRFLKQNFKRRIHRNLVKHLSKPYADLGKGAHFEYCFTGAYFSSTALRLGYPIERFLQPSFQRKFKLMNPQVAPKTITKVYLGLIRQSPRFVSHLLHFLQNILIPEALNQIFEKTSKMVNKWEIILAEEGPKGLLNHIRSKFINNSKSKVPWTISEVRFAINQAISFVSGKVLR